MVVISVWAVILEILSLQSPLRVVPGFRENPAPRTRLLLGHGHFHCERTCFHGQRWPRVMSQDVFA